jgi:hypothetical protein
MKYSRVEILEGPDDYGNFLHFRYWMADYHPGHPKGEYRTAERGQIFRAPLPLAGEVEAFTDKRGAQ